MKNRHDLPRVLHLRAKHATEMLRLARQQGAPFASITMVGPAFDDALSIDPTAKALYLETIIRWLRTGSMRFEDGRQVREILTAFHARKHRLPVEQRDIGRYARPGDLAETLDLIKDRDRIDIPDEILVLAPIVASGDGWCIVRITERPRPISSKGRSMWSLHGPASVSITSHPANSWIDTTVPCTTCRICPTTALQPSNRPSMPNDVFGRPSSITP